MPTAYFTRLRNPLSNDSLAEDSSLLVPSCRSTNNIIGGRWFVRRAGQFDCKRFITNRAGVDLRSRLVVRSVSSIGCSVIPCPD
ncbi:hypothetical protein CSKR_108292 [Clonorchis sinensis]|uniref:Uncharacterized protein n=1 Tax=Clonorchis sinensis TaxID=79923 RepID=A0A3R7DDZ5_CLOSI|nr:hypothetical protein CSKR_108292 [Clonorchis sinensis]